MSLPQDPPPEAVASTLEDGAGRYAVFANRLRTAFTAGLRYSAYSSELGEALRPLSRPAVVRSLYAVSWTYVLGDVAYAGYQAKELHKELTIRKELEEKHPEMKLKRLAHEAEKKLTQAVSSGKEDSDAPPHIHHHVPTIDPLSRSETTHVTLTCARRAVFQTLASMALPAFTVHSVVHYSQPLFKGISHHKVRALGPTVLGLAVIPALPIMFDEPVEHIIDTIFDWGEERFVDGGKVSKDDLSDLGKDLVEDVKTVLPQSTAAKGAKVAAVTTQSPTTTSAWATSSLFGSLQQSLRFRDVVAGATALS